MSAYLFQFDGLDTEFAPGVVPGVGVHHHTSHVSLKGKVVGLLQHYFFNTGYHTHVCHTVTHMYGVANLKQKLFPQVKTWYLNVTIQRQEACTSNSGLGFS